MEDDIAAGSRTAMGDHHTSVTRYGEGSPIVLVHSLGLQFAATHASRVTGLGVIAGLHLPFPALRERAQAGEEQGLDALREPTLERWFGAARLREAPDVVRYARESLTRFGLPHWVATWNALADLDVVDGLSRFEQPTLVIAGADDTSTPPSVMAGLVDSIPGAERLEVIAGAPHLLVCTHSTEVARLLGELPH